MTSEAHLQRDAWSSEDLKQGRSITVKLKFGHHDAKRVHPRSYHVYSSRQGRDQVRTIARVTWLLCPHQMNSLPRLGWQLINVEKIFICIFPNLIKADAEVQVPLWELRDVGDDDAVMRRNETLALCFLPGKPLL
mmetsp:Transcript_21974/g.64804  ORF Transcript_21974/g.64804 Transcript_21974/m.64804 type:complete len:135 (+) Transcript_21974:152-556(+)